MLLLHSLQPTPAKCQSRVTMLWLSMIPRRRGRDGSGTELQQRDPVLKMKQEGVQVFPLCPGQLQDEFPHGWMLTFPDSSERLGSTLLLRKYTPSPQEPFPGNLDVSCYFSSLASVSRNIQLSALHNSFTNNVYHQSAAKLFFFFPHDPFYSQMVVCSIYYRENALEI